MATPAPAKPPRFNETTIAIVAAALIGLVLATLLAGNPLRATILAYTDWSRPPATELPRN